MFLQVLHLAQAVLAVYGGQHSFQAIQNIRKYEEPTQKLAKYSNEAERQLRNTQTTQAAGVIALLLSLAAALFLAFRGHTLGFLARLVASPLVASCVFLARQHIQDHWGGRLNKIRVPLPKMGSYNDAQRQTDDLLQVLERLMFSWCATSVLSLLTGY